MDYCIALIDLQIAEAKDLPKMDSFFAGNKADPYCIIIFGTEPNEVEKFQTDVKRKTLEPHWQQHFRIIVKKSQIKHPLKIQVWDWDKINKNELMGETDFDISQFFNGEKTIKNSFDGWLELNFKGKKRGKIHIIASIKNKEEIETHFWKEYAKHFNSATNKSITPMEFSLMLHSVHCSINDEEIHKLFNEADKDKNGELNLDEFVALMSSDNVQKIIPEGTDEFIFLVSQKHDHQNTTIGDLMMERGFYAKIQHKKGEEHKLLVRDRKTRKEVEEKIPEYIRLAMRLMYSTITGRFAVERLKNLLEHLTKKQAEKYNSPSSRKEIHDFIEFHNLNTEEILLPLDKFKNFNEFFYRKLKDGARPISEPDNSKIAVSPADCRLNVFPTIDEAKKIWIKGKSFTLENLLNDKALANEYKDGSLVICRLAPQDYHRFHVPVDGELGKLQPINGTYFTVNPIAIKETIDVYTENKRVVTTINSTDFGKICYIAVGATMVGSVNFTRKPGDKIKRGEEMGYFAFGGSTILLLFKKGAIEFDMDLIENSSKPIETLIKVGDSIGTSLL